MKFLLVCSAAFAAGISLADTTTVTPYDKLTLQDGTSFYATVAKGVVNATLMPENPTVESGYYMLEGELTGDAALAMAPIVVDKTDIKQFTIEFKAGFVDATELTKYEGAKIGFALTSEKTASYFNGDDWVAFDAFAEGVNEDADVTLTVDFDGRQNLARFIFAGQTLKVNGSEWVSVGGIVSNTIKAYGSGAVKGLEGLTKTITAEEIVVPGMTVDVVVSKEMLDKIVAAGGVEAASKIGGMNNIEAFILTGKVGDEVVKPVAKIETKSTDNTKVNFKLDGVNVQTIKNGAVSFVIEGSTDNVNWVTIGDSATTSPSAIAMPILNAATYKFFRVKAGIVPANN